jgi:hypothetical protein
MKLLVLTSEIVQRRYIAFDIVLDQRQQITELDLMSDGFADGAWPRECGTRCFVVVKEPVTSALHDGRLPIACGAIV